MLYLSRDKLVTVNIASISLCVLISGYKALCLFAPPLKLRRRQVFLALVSFVVNRRSFYPLRGIRTILISTLIIMACTGAAAQPFSYVYIQGDKTIPFYVKMEGKMLPRYGKNYCIISELNPGKIHLQILFEQNKLPAQKFTINVPGHGYRGFLLDKQKDSYALYDLQKKNYLDINEEEK